MIPAFSDRVDYAARAIAEGWDTSCNRRFSGCMECDDGDAVALALYLRARRNPRLRANLWRYLARGRCLPAIYQNRRRNPREWARELRAGARPC